jgi:hypothetical protein
MIKALEFSTRVIDNQIQIPVKIESEIKLYKNKNIRVIVLIEKPLIEEDDSFKFLAQEQFFNGYSASDLTYDKFCF